MKKQLVIIGIVAVLVTVGLSGCETERDRLVVEKSKFVGTWQNSTIDFTTTINFFLNGTCEYDIVSGTWNVTDGKLVIVFSDGYSRIYDYVFSNNDRTLSLTQTTVGVAKVFTKQ